LECGETHSLKSIKPLKKDTKSSSKPFSQSFKNGFN